MSCHNKRCRVIRGLLSLVIFLFLSVGAEAGEGFFQVLAQSNQFYQEGRFDEAREGYQQLLEGNTQGGHLHYNLGNSWFKSGHYGKAIYHYLKAQQQLPRDEDIEANLLLALRKTSDIWDGRRDSPASAVLFWLKDFALQEHLKILAILNLLFWTTTGIRLSKPGESMEKAQQILLGVLIIGALSTGARWHMESSHHVAVVQEKSLDVFSGEGNTDEVVLQLHEGAILPVLDRKGEWIELELPNGKKGWVPEHAVLV